MIKLIDLLNDFVGRTTAYFYLFAVAISCYEITLRYVFNAPTLWAHEFVIIICAVSYLMSGGYVTKERAHVRITALFEILPRRIQRLLDGFAVLIGLVCVSLLVYASWDQSLMAIEVWEKTGSAWDPPLYGIVKPAITIGAVLVVLANLSLAVKLLRGED